MQHTAAVLRVDDDQSLTRLANYVLYDAIDRLLALGSLSLTEAALAESDLANAACLRDVFVLHMKLALFHETRKSIRVAADHAHSGLAIIEQLAALDPSNADWRRDLENCRRDTARLQSEASK